MASTISPEDFKFLSDLVMREAAIVLDKGKEYLVTSRLDPLAKELGNEGISGLVRALRNNPTSKLRAQVVDAMTTNETLFFRDSHPFDTLSQHILPELLKARSETRTLDIWCGAASTGQEPYSLAMLLREKFPQLSTWRVRITATDISPTALDRARAGRYTQMEVGRGLPARYMVKYLSRVGTEYEMNSDIRSMIDFKIFNLASNWPPMGPFDVIFMRNVLIYFSRETKQEIVNKAARILRPDGALLLGSTESLLSMETNVKREQFEKTTFYRPNTGTTKP